MERLTMQSELDWQRKEKSMGADKEWFEIIMKQANGSLMTALENQIQADIGGTREEANRVANHILDILDIANENKEQEIRNKAIDEFASTLIPRLTDAIYQKDVESMTNLINEIVEQLKSDESRWCQ